MSQTTSTLLMIRPVGFDFNEQTASTNAFQRSASSREDAQERALREFNQLARLLREHGVSVLIIDDTIEPHTPDSIFPNNWISTHDDGMIVLYPMHAVNRRFERRADIIRELTEQFMVTEILDLSVAETDGKFLEGTGSMVLDRESRICYACLSPRTDKDLLHAFCNRMGYEMMAFHATDKAGNPIYHTNVIMCVGQSFMIICMEVIPNAEEQHQIRQSTSKSIIEITRDQMNHFAGNMLEVRNEQGESLLVMSSAAYHALHPEQITELEKHAHIIHSPIQTIEDHGGGSVRCMLAEVFLKRKSVAP